MNTDAEIFKHFGLPQVIPEFPSRCISHDDNPLFQNIIDCRQPGSGKTQNAVEYVAAHPEMKFLITGNTHLLLEEINSRIAEINPNAKGRVIKGFSKACPKYQTHDDIKDAHEAGVPPKAICIRMECQNSPGRPCGYRTQYEGLFDEFGNPQMNLLIPINLIPAFDFSVFDAIIIEESTATNGKYERDYDFAFIKKEMGKMLYSKGYGRDGFLKIEDHYKFIRAINARDAKAIRSMEPMLQEAIDQHNMYTAVRHKKRKPNSDFIDDVVKVRLQSLIMCLEFTDRRKKARLAKIEEEFSTKSSGVLVEMKNTFQEAQNLTYDDAKQLSYYHLIQMKEITANYNDELEKYQSTVDMYKLTKIDHFQATWQEIIFYKQLRACCDIRYNNTIFRESMFMRQMRNFQTLFPEYKQESIVYESHFTNKETVIKVEKTNDGFYKGFIHEYYTRHKGRLRSLIRYYKGKLNLKVLILTFKQLVEKYNGKLCGVDAYWYHAFGGVNKFRDYDVLIVFGTPLPPEDWYEEKWETMYPNETIPKTVEYDNSDPEWFLPMNEKLRILVEELWLPEVYNSIHRLRPLEHNIKIIWFGKNIPNELKCEFTLKYN
ncbi:hypothetical protein MettiDRAFT_1236 [Methanolobus tindarius DSM 2278]|uniref:Uncharacterized protein n=1 Tax=Methanolobus tindarius DSM 2278 TaxID=1090322 RepID=W9DWI8_METTI|nr:hypothetical protein [Methanolobus tindarius]ETA67801.1 hypothetical protein MettiDRAFT_1236 [Methanolobus tindarius DSM 2278]